jgi:hypothetical protein
MISSPVRDEWDSKKSDYEAQLTDLLGEAWTINIDPAQIWPYGEEDGYAKQSTGSMISEYVSYNQLCCRDRYAHGRE